MCKSYRAHENTYCAYAIVVMYVRTYIHVCVKVTGMKKHTHENTYRAYAIVVTYVRTYIRDEHEYCMVYAFILLLYTTIQVYCGLWIFNILDS